MMIAVIFSILLFSLLDFFWIKVVMLPFYQSALQDILLTEAQGQLTIRMGPAFLAYAALIFSLWYLVILPYKEQGTYVILKEGAIVGACLYATYALTCWTLFKGFDFRLAFADILWGATIYSTTALATIRFKQFLVS